ncbi:hypothetical protein BASA62_009352 [Batrachochytrium salamandrivorans]|nr:hypothetical protein BASA62_009352 [Batrachochytrium salamandrivorans]
MRLSAIALSMYLIGTVSANPHPTLGPEYEGVSESCRYILNRWFNGECKHSSGKVEYHKEDTPKPTESTQGSSKSLSVSDDDKPKEPQDPQPEEQSNEDTTTPKKGPSRGSPVSIGEVATPDLIKQSVKYWEERNEKFPPGKTKADGPKREVKLLTSSDLSEPNEPQDSPTQEQSGEVTTAPNAEFNHDSSSFTGASTGPDGAIGTDDHLEEESQGSALGQTKIEAPKGGSLEPEESIHNPYESLSVSDLSEPKEPQDSPTQEQSGEVITAPNTGSNHDSSVSTGAATGPDGAIGTGAHQAKESQGSALDLAKGADSSIPDSLALESTNLNLPGKRPNTRKRGGRYPTTSNDIPKVTNVREFLALDDSEVLSKSRKEEALKLFFYLNKPTSRNGRLYTLTRISEPEKESIEQEKMAAYFESTYEVKQANQNLLKCEREIFSFPGSNPSLASKYSKAKTSQTKAIEKRALTDEEEGEYLIHLCLTARGKLLFAQSKSEQAWLKLTEEQKGLYRYIKSSITHMIFQLGM